MSTTPRTDEQTLAYRTEDGSEMVHASFAAELETELAAAKAECAEKQATFDLMFSANLRGIKMWQDAHPEHSETWPDLAKLVAWLLSELARLRAEVERLDGCCEELHAVIDNHGYPSGIDYAEMTARAEKAEADTVRMDWLEKEALQQDWGPWSMNRASIDAAMKEASK